MKLLLLGGTADARRLASRLAGTSLDIVYSVAGLVRTPAVDCQVFSGGFSQFGGLQTFIEQQHIDAVLDATHPYAATMTATAWQVTQQLGLPYWRFHRAPWQAQPNDNWQPFSNWQQLLPALADYRSVFLTAGQIDAAAVSCFSDYGRLSGQRQLLRTAVQPAVGLPDSMQWVKAIGPFDFDAELALMRTHKIDVLVSKNSGGQATCAKLAAARRLGLPVMMLARPALPAGLQAFEQLDDCCAAIVNWIQTNN